MTLDDLLTELRENVLHDRSSQIDGDSDKLWSDTTLIRYLNEAERRFARKTCCIVDKSSDITRFVTVAGYDEYVLDKSVIAIKSARFMGNARWVNGVLVPGLFGNTRPLTFTPNVLVPLVVADAADLGRGGHAQFNQYNTPGQGFYNPRSATELPPGKPMAFATDEEFDADASGSTGVVSVKLYPRPSAAFSGCLVQLRVCRMPLNPLTPTNLNATPEIPELYHMSLVDYAASRALSIVDHELGDAQRAADFGQRFEAEMEEARQETMRKAFVPMVWGFGRNGFAHEGN